MQTFVPLDVNILFAVGVCNSLNTVYAFTTILQVYLSLNVRNISFNTLLYSQLCY